MILGESEADDLFHLLCGREIGRGRYRTVFACHLNDSWVVKRDTGENYSNIAEWEIWREMSQTPLRKWLAPVKWLSARGLWLIQSRTEPITRDRLPSRLPEIFADTKSDNWGWLNGKPVCHDYGNHALYKLAAKRMGSRKANWTS